MYEFALVSAGRKLGLRHKAIKATEARTLQNGIPLTNNLAYSASSIVSIGLQDKLKVVSEQITLSYELSKPIYSVLKDSLNDSIKSVESSMRSIEKIHPVTTKEYVISQTESENGLYPVQTISFVYESGDTGVILQSIYDYLSAQKSALSAQVSEISSWQSEYNQTFGYGVNLKISVGDISPDVDKITLYSSVDGVVAMMYSTSCVKCRVPVVYTTRQEDLLLSKMENEQKKTNEHVLSNREYTFFTTVTRPNVLFWVTATDHDGNEYSQDMKMVQLYGLVYGTIHDKRNANDPDFPDKTFVTIYDDYGLTYTAAMSDFSKVDIGDEVMISKNDCKVHYKNKQVDIVNNEGVCGTAIIGKMGVADLFYDNIFMYDGAVTSLDDAYLYNVLAHSSKYEKQTPLDALAGTWLGKHPSEATTNVKIIVASSVTGKDLFSGAVSITGKIVLMENLNQYILDTEIGRIVYNTLTTASDKAEWVTLSDEIDLPSGSVEDKFCVAYAAWVEFSRGTMNESAGRVNYFITNLFMHDDSSIEKSVSHNTLVWKV